MVVEILPAFGVGGEVLGLLVNKNKNARFESVVVRKSGGLVQLWKNVLF